MDNPLPLGPGTLRFPAGLVWSYSTLKGFETCAKQFAEEKIHKTVPYVASPAQAEGNAVHQAVNAYVRTGAEVPIGARKLAQIVDIAAENANSVNTELKWGVTAELRPVPFFDEAVNLRVVIDFLAVHGTSAILIDWKTGQPRDEPMQLELCALVALQHNQHLDSCNCAFVYTEHPIKEVVFKRSQIPELVGKLQPRLQRMQHAIANGQFPATPCWACRFCRVYKCAHNPQFAGVV